MITKFSLEMSQFTFEFRPKRILWSTRLKTCNTREFLTLSLTILSFFSLKWSTFSHSCAIVKIFFIFWWKVEQKFCGSVENFPKSWKKGQKLDRKHIKSVETPTVDQRFKFSCEISIDFYWKVVNFSSDSSWKEKKKYFRPRKNPTVLAKVIWWWREDYCKAEERKERKVFQEKQKSLCYKNNYKTNRLKLWSESEAGIKVSSSWSDRLSWFYHRQGYKGLSFAKSCQ